MNTIILKVKYKDELGQVNTEQWFIDDLPGAVKEAEYWQNQGCEVEVKQCTYTSDSVN